MVQLHQAERALCATQRSPLLRLVSMHVCTIVYLCVKVGSRYVSVWISVLFTQGFIKDHRSV